MVGRLGVLPVEQVEDVEIKEECASPEAELPGGSEIHSLVGREPGRIERSELPDEVSVPSDGLSEVVSLPRIRPGRVVRPTGADGPAWQESVCDLEVHSVTLVVGTWKPPRTDPILHHGECVTT
jgi:hypothetical protein